MKTVKHTNKECRCRKWVLKMCRHSLVLLLFWLGCDKGRVLCLCDISVGISRTNDVRETFKFGPVTGAGRYGRLMIDRCTLPSAHLLDAA